MCPGAATAGMPSLQVSDIELNYESHGTGDPLVLIGGLGLAVAEMRPLINALAAAGYRVIAADNRGRPRRERGATPPFCVKIKVIPNGGMLRPFRAAP